MKLTCLILLLTPLLAFAQSEKKPSTNPDRLEVKEFDLNAEPPEPSTEKLPFSSIKIIDSRFDTSIIGFAHNPDIFDGMRNSFKRLRLKGKAADAIQTYLQSRFENSFDSSGFTLLIVIKKLWLSGIEYNKTKELDVSADFNSTKSLYCKWEYYLGKDDQYLPVKRVDTVFTLVDNLDERVKEKFKKKQKDFLRSSIQLLVEMLDFSKGIQAFDQQKKKSLQEIVNYNETRFKIPVLNNVGLAHGVFVNFEEFKNNQPSIIHFREKKKSTDLLRNQKFIEDENGNQINPYWAYFDGEEIRYGKFGNEILYRTGNTFALFNKMVWYTAQNREGVFYDRQRHEVWVPYEIDMDTGEVY